MLCAVLKTFHFSRDGIRSEQATAGTEADIPDALVAGLEREGYVRRATDRTALRAPETQAFAAAPETAGEPVEPPSATTPRRGRPRKARK